MPNGEVTLVYLEVDEGLRSEQKHQIQSHFRSIKTISLTEGETDQLISDANDDKSGRYSSQEDATASSTFTSANENVATVTNDGFITAVGAGETIITVTNGDFTATVAVTVEAVPVV